MLKAITGAAEGLSPEPSGQRYEHLKQCISLSSKQLVQDLLASLATLFSAMANAKLPNRLRPYLCSVMASLCSKILQNQFYESVDLLPFVPQMAIADRGGNFQLPLNRGLRTWVNTLL